MTRACGKSLRMPACHRAGGRRPVSPWSSVRRFITHGRGRLGLIDRIISPRSKFRAARSGGATIPAFDARVVPNGAATYANAAYVWDGTPDACRRPAAPAAASATSASAPTAGNSNRIRRRHRSPVARADGALAWLRNDGIRIPHWRSTPSARAGAVCAAAYCASGTSNRARRRRGPNRLRRSAGVRFSPDGRWPLTVARPTVNVWDTNLRCASPPCPTQPEICLISSHRDRAGQRRQRRANCLGTPSRRRSQH